MVGVFSPWIYGQGKGRKRVERELYFTQPPSIYLSYILHSLVGASRHGYTDKGRVERALLHPATIHIFVLYPPQSPATLGNGMVGVFSPWIYELLAMDIRTREG